MTATRPELAYQQEPPDPLDDYEPEPDEPETGVLPVTAPCVSGRVTLFFDVAAMIDGGIPDPPAPIACRRTDGVGLFYAGQVNWLFGDAESGKTLLALATVAESLNAGRRALVIDLDHNGPQGTVSRLLMLGAPVTALRDPDRFRYVEPEDADHLRAVVADAVQWRPAVVVVDSVGELLPCLGLSSNSPDDFTFAHATVLKRLAVAGACVVAIDHLAKNIDSRSYGPTGTTAKKRAVGGVSIRVVVKDQFTPGKGGSATLTLHKDRHGGLRAQCPTDGKEPYAGTFVLEETAGTTTWRVTAPSGTVQIDDTEALAQLDPPPTSVRDVRTRMHWRTARASEALKAWKQSVTQLPTQRWVTGNTPCSDCGEPLNEVLADAGETTHPTCQEDKL